MQTSNHESWMLKKKRKLKTRTTLRKMKTFTPTKDHKQSTETQ